MRPINGPWALICQNARSRNICACPRPLLEKYFLNLTNYQQAMFLERKQSQSQRNKATGCVFWPTIRQVWVTVTAAAATMTAGRKHRQTTEIQIFPHPGKAASSPKYRRPEVPPWPCHAPRPAPFTPIEGRSRKWARWSSPSPDLAGCTPVFLFPVHHTDPVRPGCDVKPVRTSILIIQPSWPQG